MSFALPILGDGMPVTIAEAVLPFRVLVLAGKDRPEPIAESAKQRAETTWYPGASRASVQVMGSQREPLVLRGWWRDPLTVLTDGGPQARLAVARGLLQGGATCYLSWGDTIGAYGRVTRVDTTTQRQNIIRYEIEFTVDQPNDAVALVPLPLVAAAASQLGSAIQAASAVFEAAASVARTANVVDALVGPPG